MTIKKKKRTIRKKSSKFADYSMKCPYCDTKLEQSVNDDYVRCPNCLSHYRKEETYTKPSSKLVKDHYIKDLNNILESDKGHYDRFFKFSRTSRVKLLYSNKSRIVSFGGGFPKFESFLKPKLIDVYDLFPKLYSSSVDRFIDMFKFNGKIKYHKLELNEKNISDVDIESGNIVTFIHILEHFHYYQIEEILSKLPSGVTGIIYGPNAGRQPPMGENWIHFIGPDHISILSLEAIINLISKIGYTNIINYSYDCDMIVIFKT